MQPVQVLERKKSYDSIAGKRQQFRGSLRKEKMLIKFAGYRKVLYSTDSSPKEHIKPDRIEEMPIENNHMQKTAYFEMQHSNQERPNPHIQCRSLEIRKEIHSPLVQRNYPTSNGVQQNANDERQWRNKQIFLINEHLKKNRTHIEQNQPPSSPIRSNVQEFQQTESPKFVAIGEEEMTENQVPIEANMRENPVNARAVPFERNPDDFSFYQQVQQSPVQNSHMFYEQNMMNQNEISLNQNHIFMRRMNQSFNGQFQENIIEESLVRNFQLCAQFSNPPILQSNFPGNNEGVNFYPNILSNQRILYEPYHMNAFVNLMEQKKLDNHSPDQQLEVNFKPNYQFLHQLKEGAMDIQAQTSLSPSDTPSIPFKKKSIQNFPKNFPRKILFQPQTNQSKQRNPQVNKKQPQNQGNKKVQPNSKIIQSQSSKIILPTSNIYTVFEKQKVHEKKDSIILELQNFKVRKTLKNYLIYQKILGTGSYGSVYLGYNIKKNEKVAVKQIKLKKDKNLLEVECLKQISHPNIVTLYDYFIDEKQKECYLFLQFCEQNLRQHIQKLEKKDQQVLQVTAKIAYIEQLIEGMNALNQKGFIHRDLKFENILVKNNSTIKICDFGLCRKVNHKLQVQSVRCGTPYTMAPQIYFHSKSAEQIPTYTEKSDIFSLAVLMHQIIYSIHPFDYNKEDLKKLNRIDLLRTNWLSSRFKLMYGLDVLWIQKIIQGGLKKVEERISWLQVMNIYKKRNQAKKQPVIQSPPDQRKKILKKETPSNSHSAFLKKPKNQIQDVQIKSKKAEACSDRKELKKPQQRFNKPTNPEQKSFDYIKEAQKFFKTKPVNLEKDYPQIDCRRDKYNETNQNKVMYQDSKAIKVSQKNQTNISNNFADLKGMKQKNDEQRLQNKDKFNMEEKNYQNTIKQNKSVKINDKTQNVKSDEKSIKKLIISLVLFTFLIMTIDLLLKKFDKSIYQQTLQLEMNEYY